MTDFSAFAPDPIADDPFAADAAPEDDPFGAPPEDDPFGAPQDDPFAGDQHEEQHEDPFTGDAESAPVQQEFEEDAFGLGGQEELDQQPTLDPEPEPEQSFGLPESTAQGEWQAQRAEVLRKRRDAARDRKEQQKEAAKGQLKKFYEDREARIEKVKAQNREDEKQVTAEMASLMEFGSQWEKVHKLVNLQPKPNEKPGTSRVARMRALLIQLKHEKTAA